MCSDTGRIQRRQERILTDIEDPCIEHADQASYLINTHALHNAALIRKLLPRHLTAPIPHIHPDAREAAHHRMAASLRQAQEARRSKEAAARKERRETAMSKKGTQGSRTVPAGGSNVEAEARRGDESDNDDAVVEEPSTPANTRRVPRPRKRARLAVSVALEVGTEGSMVDAEHP